MKILFVSHDDGKYGASKSLIKMILILKDRYNITPILITRKYNELNKVCNENLIENYTIPYVNCITFNDKNKLKRFFCKKIQNFKRVLMNYISIYIIKKRIDINKINAIHTNVSTIDFGAILAEKYHIPHFWHIREFGELDINACSTYKNYINMINSSKKIFAISNIIREYWIKKGVNKNKIITIYNGIDNTEFIYKEKNKSRKNLKIIFSGSAAPHKGVHQALKAMKILKNREICNVELDIYGDYSNEYGNEMKKYTLQNDIGDIVQFKGYCANMKKVLGEYDIGLVCSKSEAFGRVTIEYMLSGIVVIASNTGANEEIIDNKKDGLIYNFDKPNDLANKIQYCIENRELLIEYRERGHKKVINSFSAIKNAELVYKQIEYNTLK